MHNISPDTHSINFDPSLSTRKSDLSIILRISDMHHNWIESINQNSRPEYKRTRTAQPDVKIFSPLGNSYLLHNDPVPHRDHLAGITLLITP